VIVKRSLGDSRVKDGCDPLVILAWMCEIVNMLKLACSVLLALQFLLLKLIDMTPGELQWLSSHLGHDVATHKNSYRQHGTAVEMTKAGKLLLAVDSRNVSYSGKKITALLDESPSDVEPDVKLDSINNDESGWFKFILFSKVTDVEISWIFSLKSHSCSEM
jgi:hypothetical protein